MHRLLRDKNRKHISRNDSKTERSPAIRGKSHRDTSLLRDSSEEATFLRSDYFIFNLCMKVIILNLLLKSQRFVGDAGVL